MSQGHTRLYVNACDKNNTKTTNSQKNSKPNEPGHYALKPCLHVPISGQGATVDADADSIGRECLVIVEVEVASQDVALELFLVGVPELGGLGVKRARAVVIVRTRRCVFMRGHCLLVRLAQETLQTQQDALHVINGAPFVLEDVQTDAAGEVDVGVVDGGLEEDGRRGVGIVVGEGEGELQVQALVRCLGRASDGRCPGEQVAVGVGESGDAGRGLDHELHQLGLQAICMRKS